MKRKYDEIMEHIAVTQEMRQRVLDRIAQENITPVHSKIVRFPSPSLKKYLSIAACLVLLLVGVTTLPHLLDRTEPEPPVLVTPNIVEVDSLQDLSALVGFEVTEEFSLPFEVEKRTYCSYWNELAEISYSGKGHSAVFRQSLGTDDCSGDYNTYHDITEIIVSGLNITLKGNDGIYVIAIWTDGIYTYSLSFSPGAEENVWQNSLNR